MQAVAAGDAAAAKALLSRGADHSKRNEAVWMNVPHKHMGLCRFRSSSALFHIGVRARLLPAPQGDAALHLAVANGHVDCLNLLLARGADPDRPRADDGASALIMAATGALDSAFRPARSARSGRSGRQTGRSGICVQSRNDIRRLLT